MFVYCQTFYAVTDPHKSPKRYCRPLRCETEIWMFPSARGDIFLWIGSKEIDSLFCKSLDQAETSTCVPKNHEIGAKGLMIDRVAQRHGAGSHVLVREDGPGLQYSRLAGCTLIQSLLHTTSDRSSRTMRVRLVEHSRMWPKSALKDRVI